MNRLFTLSLLAVLCLPTTLSTSAQTPARTDTAFMRPEPIDIGEVVVIGREPAWIRPVLKRCAREREQKYQRLPMRMKYNYNIRYDTLMPPYAFESRGIIAMPSLHDVLRDSLFRISTIDNVVRSADSVPRTHFVEMQFLCAGHMACLLDRRFIRTHEFRQKTPIPSEPSDTVELIFWSRKYRQDRGTLLVDTARCEIVGATRHTGLDYNQHERVIPLVRMLTRAMFGLKWEYWDVEEQAEYRRIGQSLYPARLSISIHEKRSEHAGKEHYSGVWNLSADITLSPTTAAPPTAFIELPRYVWSSVIYIETKARRQRKEALQQVVLRHEKL